ncbi:MAG: heavy metal translocating P-type ATPase, partial [Pseudomonadota bacterium]
MATQALLDTGKRPRPEEASEAITLTIKGMSCGSCVARVERALAETPGITEAHVNLASQTARLSAQPGRAAAAIAALKTAGYEAEQAAGAAEATRADEAPAASHTNLLLAALLTLPVFLLEMGSHLFPPVHHWIMGTLGQSTSHLIQFGLTTALVLGPGRHFFTKGVASLARRAPDMNALVALGAGAAYLYSLVATFAPAVLPEASRAVYYEAAAV